MNIDVTFDHRSDSHGKDPDSASATLRRHHQLLWSKRLPSGELFTLKTNDSSYLTHESALGNFLLSSDSISNSMRARKSMANIISQIDEKDLDAFQAIGATIGGYIIFPSNKVADTQTINVSRGFNRKIGDRFDLTLECIRRHYLNEPNPLEGTLNNYGIFFNLFESFESYVEFFLLQDLLSSGKVNFFLPFKEDFSSPAQPTTVSEYHRYMDNSMAFTSARNRRIQGL